MTEADDSPTRCITGSWPGQNQCVSDAEGPDYLFCFTCWLSVAGMGPDCGCDGCAIYFEAIR